MENEVLRTILDRQTIRRYSQRVIPRELLLDLLHAADRAPSAFNLQPWRFAIVDEPELRKKLCFVCLSQSQVLEAPASVVFFADTTAWRKPYDRILNESVECGAVSPELSSHYRRWVSQLFSTGPLNLWGSLKRLALPFLRLRHPVPDVLGSRRETADYLAGQTMLAVSAFILAAKSIGLDTCPLGAFDSERLRRLLEVPASWKPVLVVTVGYRLEGLHAVPSVRLPLEGKLWNGPKER